MVGVVRSLAPLARVIFGVLFFALPSPLEASAQTILGTVLDQLNEAPVGGVVVTLVERDGDERLRVLSDSAGRFVLTPPEPGEYSFVTERFGYLETVSPLFALGTEGRTTLELMVIPEPLGLEGVEVSVEDQAAEELRLFGLTPTTLGNRWIDRSRIEAIQVKRDMGTILELTGQAGLRVVRDPTMGLCISQIRATRMGVSYCSLIIFNGVPMGGQQALSIDPDAIEGIAILPPMEASTFYGTAGGSGAILVWTARGG